MKKISSTFCVHPFRQLNTTNSGEYRVCCESLGTGMSALHTLPEKLWNSEFYKKLRKDLINGVRNSHCERCWFNENKEALSTRQKELYTVSNDQILDYISNTDKDGYLHKQPEIFEFKVGNLCNLKCITCTQIESSQHESEIKKIEDKGHNLPELLKYIKNHEKIGNQVFRHEKESQETLISNFNTTLHSVKNLQIVGGEPLINPLTGKILDAIIDKGLHDNIELSIVSNLVDSNDSYVEKSSYFKKCIILPSIDHTDEEKFNYIRFPSKFQQVKQNLKKLIKNDFIRIEISFTISIFNILDIDKIIFDLIEMFAKHEKTCIIQIGHVSLPRYYAINALDKQNKKSARAALLSAIDIIKDSQFIGNKNQSIDVIQGLIQLVNNKPVDYNSIVNEKYRVLNLYDEIRQTDFKKLYGNSL